MARTRAPFIQARGAAGGRTGLELLLGHSTSRWQTSGIAIKMNSGVMRIEHSPAYRLTSKRRRSRGRKSRRDQLSAANVASTTSRKGQYSRWWKLGEAHSAM